MKTNNNITKINYCREPMHSTELLLREHQKPEYRWYIGRLVHFIAIS